jgi:hypothetical protein
MLRIADGPDEVHEVSLARRELKPYPLIPRPPSRKCGQSA